MQMVLSRRRFLATGSLACAAGLAGLPRPSRAEPPPETTIVRLPTVPGDDACQAAKYIARELLNAEGLTDVQYVQGETGVDPSVWIAKGLTDFDLNFPPAIITSMDAGVPIKVLAGLHTGCLELITVDDITSVIDLKGRRVGIEDLSSHPHILLTIMAAYVGLDPKKDIEWVTSPGVRAMQLFADGKIDAFLAAPPEPQQLRARKIGHTILNTTVDRPWSQYFCCMVAATTDYASKYPVATKRILRALLKSADVCASQPSSVAQELVDSDLAANYDTTFQILTEIRYDRWREFDPEDTLRFYALRMRETGLIKSDPKSIIAEHTDWRFLDELKQELKA